jgi:hypothetical protein
LQLRNNQVGHILTVTPVLRTADGTETPLFPVVVQPQEVKTVDVATAIGNSAPQLIGTYGSLALRYSAPNQINLYAVSMVMGVGHSIAFHIDATGEDQAENVGGREGIWWLPNATANDYLVLMNQGQIPLQLSVSLYDASGKASVQRLALPPRGMNRLSVRQLVSAAKLAGSYGGIKVSAASHAGSLDTLHVLFDENAGFSAVMKMFFYDPRAQLQERDYAKTGQWTLRAPMLALSNPDPSLAFPVGTVLHPQLFIRNTTSKPIDASLAFNWRSDTSSGKSPATILHLSPFETRRIDVAALQDGKTLPQTARWASVTLATSGLPDEVVAVAASYDQSLHYGAQTPFSDQLAAHWVGGQWDYDPQHDSIITAGNGGSQPTQAAFTIFYNQGTQKYQLEQNLQPGEQMWMDIGKLIRENVPDKTGKTLPSDLTTGSYEFRDLTNKGVGTLFEGKIIYDKTYGHVTYGCSLCCGYTTPMPLWYDPISVIITSFQDDGVFAWYPCENQYDDVSTAFYNRWSSGAPSVVTVDYYGTHNGIAVGSTTSQTFAVLQSNNVHLMCPTHGYTPNGSANVTPAFTVGYNAYIAVDHITAATSCTWAGLQVPYIYMGDAYRGTYRAAEQLQVVPDLQQSSNFFNDIGESRNYGKASPANGSTLSSTDEDGIANDCWLWNNAKKTPQPTTYDVSYPYAHQAQVHYVGSVYNSLESSIATITWDMRTVLDTTNPSSPTAYVNYNHTCYPAHQIKVNGAVIYSYIPPDDSSNYLFTCLVLHDYKRVGVTQPTSVPTH